MAGTGAEDSTTLEALLRESGRRLDPRAAELRRTASEVQAYRHRMHLSDTELLTRSTLLWVLVESDRDVRAALRKAGLNAARLGSLLDLTGDLEHLPLVGFHLGEEPGLHPDLLAALTWYLRSARADLNEVSPADLAMAIVGHAATDSGGLLPERLRRLGVSVDDALGGLSSLTSREARPGQETVADAGAAEASTGPTVTSKRVPGAGPTMRLSETMSGVEAQLDGPHRASSDQASGLAASDIGAAIAQRHPEYAGGAVGRAELDARPAALRQDWAKWRRSVAALYDADAVAASRHRALDGRLFLAGLGVLDAGLRDALETAGAWAPLLVELDDAVARSTPGLAEHVARVQLRYGYSSDRVGGEDRLGVDGEVRAVCEVITDPKVSPPLAIGLFGAWGTGKSFFMERMRERIDFLSESRRHAAIDGGPPPLRVVQIRFNAWHYADTSLWASLAVEIFERLVDPEPVNPELREKWLRDRGDESKPVRKRLLAELQTYRDAKAAVGEVRAALSLQRRDVENRLDQAAVDRQEAIASMSLTDVAGELAKDPGVRESLKPLAADLGFEPAVEELGALAAELRGASRGLRGIWQLTAAERRPFAFGVGAVLVVLVLVTLAFVLQGGAWLGTVVAGGMSVVTAVVAAAQVVRPAVTRLKDCFEHLGSARHVISERAAELRARRSQEELSLQAELARLDRQIGESTRQLAELDEKIAAADAEAESLTVGRRLYDFLADRAAGYQKHQGVVGLLHRDFRFLDMQLRALPDEAETADPPDERRVRRTDRVILYIDDLDRCPPAKVLEVLEAVHLLLALELFVVVVGVDPRWLQRSLRHQYRDLVTSGDPRTDPYLRVMPIEYLEKIFQIPLTLPVMQPTGFAELISSLGPDFGAPLTAVETPSAAHPSPPREQQSTHRAITNESPGGDRAPFRGALGVEHGSSAAGDAVGPGIDLTEPEVAFARTLGPLVTSPRAAKRLMNTYRLIRATQNVGSASRFLGAAAGPGTAHGRPGEYQAVLTLLAVTAGFPTMADRLIVALQVDAAAKGVGSWPVFVRELAPAVEGRPGELVPRDLLAGEADDSVLRDELATWMNLQAALATALEWNSLHDLAPYRDWCRKAARFSFTL